MSIDKPSVLAVFTQVDFFAISIFFLFFHFVLAHVSPSLLGSS